MSHYEGTGKKEADRIDLIKTCVWAFAFVMFWLCLFIYGITWISHVEVTDDDIYARRRMAKEIKDLRIEYGNHVHRYFDGRIK